MVIAKLLKTNQVHKVVCNVYKMLIYNIISYNLSMILRRWLGGLPINITMLSSKLAATRWICSTSSRSLLQRFRPQQHGWQPRSRPAARWQPQRQRHRRRLRRGEVNIRWTFTIAKRRKTPLRCLRPKGRSADSNTAVEKEALPSQPTTKGAPKLTLPSSCLLCGLYVSYYSTHLSGRAD